MVGADFEGLITSHDQTDLVRRSVLKQTDIARAPFFPLISSGIKSEKLCAPEDCKVSYQQRCCIDDKGIARLHFEKGIFVLFTSLYFYLLCEPDDGLKMKIGLFFLL